MENILESFDKDDYDVVKELIPYFRKDAWEEFLKTEHMFITTKNPLYAFNVAERISEYLIDNNWEGDLELVQEEVEAFYDTENF